MPFDPHQRARLLMDRELIAGIAPEDAAWLRGHTAGCPQCEAAARLSARAVRGLGAFSFEIDAAMTARTQRAVAARVQQRFAAPVILRPPFWRWVSVAAAAILLAAAPIYQRLADKRQSAAAAGASDSLLLERVEARVARRVPSALAPLASPYDATPGENR